MTAASPGIADAYASEYGIERPTVVLNTFPINNSQAFVTSAGSVRPAPSIYWFSQTIGHDRGLQSAIQALAKSAVRPHLYLRGACSTKFAEELRQIAREHGVEDHLHLLPLAPPHQMEMLAAEYDVGLCSEIGHTPNRRIALTNKQFTYLLAGIPVLMSEIPAHRSFAAEADGAVTLFKTDDASSLASAIDRVLSAPSKLRAMRERAWQLGQTHFNWQIDGRRLVELVRTVIAPQHVSQKI